MAGNESKKTTTKTTVQAEAPVAQPTASISPSASIPLQPNNTPLKTLLQKTDVLLMLYPKDNDGYFSEDISSHDEINVYDLVKEKKDRKNELIILLDTGGGSVYSAVKIMDCLRSYYTKISIAVPQEAKSSGTMMCFGADELIMSAISELGPLDKPMPHPDNENSYISALDIVKSIDGMLETAIETQVNHARKLRSTFGMRMNGCLEISSDYVSKLIAPMLSKEDVKTYNQAKRLLAIAEKYGNEFLDKHMFKRITNARIKKTIIEIVIRQFIWFYPDHAFAVRRTELREYLFTVLDAEKQDYWGELWKEFEQNLSTKNKIIKFMEA